MKSEGWATSACAFFCLFMACIVWVLWQTIISPLQKPLYSLTFCLELWPKEYMWSSERDCQAWGHFKDFQHISLTHIACRFCLWVLIKLATFSQSLPHWRQDNEAAGNDRTGQNSRQGSGHRWQHVTQKTPQGTRHSTHTYLSLSTPPHSAPSSSFFSLSFTHFFRIPWHAVWNKIQFAIS